MAVHCVADCVTECNLGAQCTSLSCFALQWHILRTQVTSRVHHLRQFLHLQCTLYAKSAPVIALMVYNIRAQCTGNVLKVHTARACTTEMCTYSVLHAHQVGKVRYWCQQCITVRKNCCWMQIFGTKMHYWGKNMRPWRITVPKNRTQPQTFFTSMCHCGQWAP